MEESTSKVTSDKKAAEEAGDEEKAAEHKKEESKLHKQRFRLISKRATQEAAAQTYKDDGAEAFLKLDELTKSQAEITRKDTVLVELITDAEEGLRRAQLTEEEREAEDSARREEPRVRETRIQKFQFEGIRVNETGLSAYFKSNGRKSKPRKRETKRKEKSEMISRNRRCR